MTPDDAAKLLAVAASFDNRKPDGDAALAWSVALQGYEFAACRDAIVAHYRVTSDWLMPAHVITAVRRVRNKAIAEEAAYTPPPGLDPDRTADYTRWLVEARDAAARGESPPPAPPASVRGRDVIRELGVVGLDPAPANSAREALKAARAEAAARSAAERDARLAHDATLAAARDADRKAREGVTDVA